MNKSKKAIKQNKVASRSPRLVAFLRIMRTGLLNFIRNAWLSTAATAIMVVTLTILLGTFVLNKALDDTIKDIAQDITVSIYLKDEAETEEIEELEVALRGSEEIKEVTYIDKDMAQALYLERNQNNPDLLEAVSIVGNAFPASYEVELTDLSQNDQLVRIVRSDHFAGIIDRFDETRLQTVDRVGDAQRFITTAGVGAGILFAVISILVIFNTIRMAIFTRSDEIKIMRLIGATNGYIRGPFLFESMLYGIFAGIISLIIIYTSVNALGPKVNQHVYFDPTIAMLADNWPLFVGGVLLAGILIGVVSSGLAAARYMRR